MLIISKLDSLFAPSTLKSIKVKGPSMIKFSEKVFQIISLVISLPLVSAIFCIFEDNSTSAPLGNRI